ncbi:hypothetical protein VdG1_01432 [Verticillium dahliae VDG1]|nr:hypothetical protein VdG1_01432 [Verticillium dahliae VDG1]
MSEKKTVPSKAAAAPAAQQQKARDLGRVLVIGGNGFLGHHVVNQILDEPLWSASAVSVIALKCQRNRRPDADRVAYHEADISDADRLLSIFEDVKPDVVIHTASPAPHAAAAVANDLFKKVNVDGTAAVIRACQQTGVTALVYTSSASVISDNKSDLINADERWPLIRGDAQTEYYTETKAEAEQLVLAANRQEDSKLLTTAIRPAGIFGEGDTMTPTFTRQRCVFSCMTRYYNITKAKRVLGYRPIVSLDDGIKRGVRWFLDQEAAGLIEKVV